MQTEPRALIPLRREKEPRCSEDGGAPLCAILSELLYLRPQAILQWGVAMVGGPRVLKALRRNILSDGKSYGPQRWVDPLLSPSLYSHCSALDVSAVAGVCGRAEDPQELGRTRETAEKGAFGKAHQRVVYKFLDSPLSCACVDLSLNPRF